MKGTLLFALALAIGAVALFPGCGGTACDKALDHQAECMGTTTTTSSSSSTGTGTTTTTMVTDCTGETECEADCINSSSCEAILGSDKDQTAALQQCIAECQAGMGSF